MRIATGGIHLESNSFAEILATRQGFMRSDTLSGISAAAQDACQSTGVSLIPLGTARSAPSGLLSLATFERLAAPILEKARTLSYDAILLTLHGAMLLESMRSGEVELVKRLRQVVPADIKIALTLDLHGNITEELCDSVSFISALRTAPHRDGVETFMRAVKLLQRLENTNETPATAYRKIPLVLPGEALMTSMEPGASLYRTLTDYEKKEGCLITNLFTGFAWSDTPQTGMSVCVTATTHEQAADFAEQIAEDVLACRPQMKLPHPLASLTQAFSELPTDVPVFISDTGDNITAGGRGDSTQVFEHALRGNVQGGLFAPLWEPLLDIDNLSTSALNALVPELKLIRTASTTTSDLALVASPIGDVILSSERIPFVSLSQFEALGIDLSTYRYVVVKLGYLYPELADLGWKSILADTQGCAPINLARLPYSVVDPRHLLLFD